jgi:hypothetical protein
MVICSCIREILVYEQTFVFALNATPVRLAAVYLYAGAIRSPNVGDQNDM